MVCRETKRHSICRLAAWLIVLTMVLSVFPPIDLSAADVQGDRWIVFDGTAGGPYNNIPIVINEETMEQYKNYQYNGRYNIRITGSPYSVTVQGLTNVDIVFSEVTIDRSEPDDSLPTTLNITNGKAF